MGNLKDVIYLSAEDYNTLYNNGTVTINGVTLTYDANNVYIIPDNTQAQIDAITALIPSGATTSNKLATASDISGITDLIPSTATSSNKLATASDIPTIPSNNITGSGTSGSLTKFNGNNTITNGPALSSTISSQTQSTKFLREDGSWSAPSYTNIGAYISEKYLYKDTNHTISSGDIDLFRFYNNTSTGFTHIFLVSMSSNWENYIPIGFTALITSTLESASNPVNILNKSNNVVSLTINKDSSSTSGKLTLKTNNPIQGIIQIQVIHMSLTSISWLIS